MPARLPISDDDRLALAAAEQYCRSNARRLFIATALLPRPKRSAVCAIWAFCRLIELAIDAAPIDATAAPACEPGCECGDEMARTIDLLRQRLDEIYSGRLAAPPEGDSERLVLAAVRWAVGRYQLPRELFLELADARKLDRCTVRYATWSALRRHCQRTSGTTATLLAMVLGLRGSDGLKYAVTLGTATRFGSLLQSVGRDFDAGHIYLPMEDMARFGYGERDLAARRLNDAWRGLIRFEIDRARELYRESAAGLGWLAEAPSRFFVATIIAAGSADLRTIERRRFDVFNGAAPAAPLDGFRKISDVWRLAMRRQNRRVPNVF